jgi:hypothetical protein
MSPLDFAIGVPEIVSFLHPDPQAAALTIELAKLYSDGTRDGFPFGEQIEKMLARNAEPARRLRAGKATRVKNFVQNAAGMGGFASLAAAGYVLGHSDSLNDSSKSTRKASRLSNSDAAPAVDVNRIAGQVNAAQPMATAPADSSHRVLLPAPKIKPLDSPSMKAMVDLGATVAITMLGNLIAERVDPRRAMARRPMSLRSCPLRQNDLRDETHREPESEATRARKRVERTRGAAGNEGL